MSCFHVPLSYSGLPIYFFLSFPWLPNGWTGVYFILGPEEFGLLIANWFPRMVRCSQV
jgi:hypothetical protein